LILCSTRSLAREWHEQASLTVRARAVGEILVDAGSGEARLILARELSARSLCQRASLAVGEDHLARSHRGPGGTCPWGMDVERVLMTVATFGKSFI
jgi:hypothetical protein